MVEISFDKIYEEKIMPFTSQLPGSVSLMNFPFIQERYSGEAIKYSRKLDQISEDLSKRLPQALYKLPPTVFINTLYVFDETRIILLVYKAASFLHYYQKDYENLPLEVNISEDSLGCLEVDLSRKLAIVGGGLFETRIFVYNLDDFSLLTTLNSTGVVKSLSLCSSHGFIASINRQSDVIKWDLNNLGSFSVVSNGKFAHISSCEAKGWFFVATTYGKIVSFADEKFEIGEGIEIHSLHSSPSGKYLSIDSSKKILIYEAKGLQLTQKYSKPTVMPIKHMCFTQADVLVTALVDGSLIIWDFKVNRIPLAAKQSRINRVSYHNGKLYTISAGTVVSKIEFPDLPIQYEIITSATGDFTPSSSHVCYSSKSSLMQINLQNGQVANLATFDADINRIAFINNELVFVATKADFCLLSIDNSLIEKEKNTEEEFINAIVVDNSRGCLYTGGNKKTIKIFSFHPFTLLKSIPAHNSAIMGLVLVNNKTVLISRDNSFIKVWDLNSYVEIVSYEIKSFFMALSRDERHLYVSSNDSTIKVIDLVYRNILTSITIGKGFCYGMCFTKDRKHFITSSVDSYLRFWDAKSYTCIFMIQAQGSILSLKLSEDEKFILYKVDLTTTNLYVIENPLADKSTAIYSPHPNYYDFITYFLDIKDRQQPAYNQCLEFSVIMPYMLTNLHIFSYCDLKSHVKCALNSGASNSGDTYGNSPLSIALSMNHKNSALAFIKYLTKSFQANPFLGNSLTPSNLYAMNEMGFEALLPFYDSFMVKVQHSKVPVSISDYYSLPRIVFNNEIIPQKNWFFHQEAQEDGVAIEFLVSVMGLNTVSGSQESIMFLKSITLCTNQEIFRSKFIQSYIECKWKRNRIYVTIECIIYIIYLCLLSAISVSRNKLGLQVVFFVIGFFLSFYEVLQVLGGLKVYFKDVWNFVDLCRTVMLIVLVDAYSLHPNNYAAALLVLNLISWIRGVSYFRIFSKTRYMINLITEVIKDVLPFLVIVAYSTIAFAFVLMLMNLDSTDFFSYFTTSYLINLGAISTPSYNWIQWICFIFVTILNPLIMMNLIIAIMGDSHDKVQESKDIADFKELTNLSLELEVATVWRRHQNSETHRLHICQEVQTKDIAKNWLGKVREIKNIINSVKANQTKLVESNTKILQDNSIMKEQLTRLEKIILGLKEKITDSKEVLPYEIVCEKQHLLTFQHYYEKSVICSKCRSSTEVAYSCEACLFYLCKPCYKILYKEKVVKSNLLCYRGHSLTFIPDHSQYKALAKKVFNCAWCKKKMYQNSYNCSQCKWDVCRRCINVLARKCELAWNYTCPKIHNLAWNPRSHPTYKCNSCTQVFNRAGSFRCNECDYDMCLKCFDDISS